MYAFSREVPSNYASFLNLLALCARQRVALLYFSRSVLATTTLIALRARPNTSHENHDKPPSFDLLFQQPQQQKQNQIKTNPINGKCHSSCPESGRVIYSLRNYEAFRITGYCNHDYDPTYISKRLSGSRDARM